MKQLILVCGPNGVGKSTACRELVSRLPGTAYIDSDWCRCMNPFGFTPEQIDLVISNISMLMANYFRCSTIDRVIFQYGFHGPRKRIWEGILEVLKARGIEYRFCPIILECERQENIRRMVQDGRSDERIERALAMTRGIYDDYIWPRIDVTRLTVAETVEAIVDTLASSYGETGSTWPSCPANSDGGQRGAIC